MTDATAPGASAPEGLQPWKRMLPGADGFYHPCSEHELAALVREAARRGVGLRVRGSAHSVAAAIYTDARQRGGGGGAGAIDVMLDRYGAVHVDEARGEVTAEAGCHLGVDPRDPTGMSRWDRSLLAQLDRRGLALPDLGGVAHQTVAGFFMTGSCGGTVTHAIDDALVAVRWIDGTGAVREARRGVDPHFDAVACSMGLLGVVSTVTLRCVPRFDITGVEAITREDGCAYDLFADGDAGLEGFLRRTEYARLMWWPQRGVERVVTWQARRMTPADYTAETGPPGALVRRPYSVLGDGLPTPALTRVASGAMQRAGGAFFDAIALATHASRAAVRALPPLARPVRGARGVLERAVLAPVLRQFLPLSGARPQRFWDSWHHGLPMDGEMSDAAFPTWFTELFVPLARAGEVTRALRAHFRAGGYDATGAYIFELYAARAARPWLHPAHGMDALRVDVFWFARNRDEPTAFFRKVWDLLAPFGYRAHWGKHLPTGAGHGPRYLRARYPRWDEFLALRRAYDPRGVFLTDYWRRALLEDAS